MEGTVLNRQLSARRSSRVRFELATESDDSEIRHLLRDNPMPGPVALSLEREPSYFGDVGLLEEEKQTIVARQQGHVVCVGTCATRWRFVRGEKRRVGYLGGLRLDKSVTGRFDILRRGYEFFRDLQGETPADLYFTSIAAENARARQFLERGLPGMPDYDFVGEFVTLLLSVPRRGEVNGTSDNECDLDELCHAVNAHNQQYDFAPCWSAGELSTLQALGLGCGDFQVMRNGARVAACAALWDQRAFKQTVIRGYSTWLSRLRPMMNLAARITRRPHWPEVGATVAHAFVSHLAIAPDHPPMLVRMIRGLLSAAARKEIELLTVGFAVNDPCLATVRAHFRCREYRSRIYLVRWPEMTTIDLRGRCLRPDVALL